MTADLQSLDLARRQFLGQVAKTAGLVVAQSVLPGALLPKPEAAEVSRRARFAAIIQSDVVRGLSRLREIYDPTVFRRFADSYEVQMKAFANRLGKLSDVEFMRFVQQLNLKAQPLKLTDRVGQPQSDMDQLVEFFSQDSVDKRALFQAQLDQFNQWFPKNFARERPYALLRMLKLFEQEGMDNARQIASEFPELFSTVAGDKARVDLDERIRALKPFSEKWEADSQSNQQWRRMVGIVVTHFVREYPVAEMDKQYLKSVLLTAHFTSQDVEGLVNSNMEAVRAAKDLSIEFLLFIIAHEVGHHVHPWGFLDRNRRLQEFVGDVFGYVFLSYYQKNFPSDALQKIPSQIESVALRDFSIFQKFAFFMITARTIGDTSDNVAARLQLEYLRGALPGGVNWERLGQSLVALGRRYQEGQLSQAAMKFIDEPGDRIYQFDVLVKELLEEYFRRQLGKPISLEGQYDIRIRAYPISPEYSNKQEQEVQFLYALRVDFLASLGDNKAMTTAQTLKGGIDLNAAQLPLTTQTQAGEIRFQTDPAMVEQYFQTPGFEPSILSIQALPAGPAGPRALAQFLSLPETP